MNIVGIISTAVISCAIAAYIVIVVRRNIKRLKDGKLCGCGCDNCPNKTRECKKEKD